MAGNRNAGPSSGGGGVPGLSVNECEKMIQRGLKGGCSATATLIALLYILDPKVKFLKAQLEKLGCVVRSNFFKGYTCKQAIGGGYSRGEGVVVCCNHLLIQDQVTQVMIHELIHAYDDCRAANFDWENCAHHACSEIRASHLSGDCHFKRELLQGSLKIRGHEQECVKRRVLQSMASNPNCSELGAKDAMEGVWNICYNDTKPFDGVP